MFAPHTPQNHHQSPPRVGLEGCFDRRMWLLPGGRHHHWYCRTVETPSDIGVCKLAIAQACTNKTKTSKWMPFGFNGLLTQFFCETGNPIHCEQSKNTQLESPQRKNVWGNPFQAVNPYHPTLTGNCARSNPDSSWILIFKKPSFSKMMCLKVFGDVVGY